MASYAHVFPEFNALTPEFSRLALGIAQVIVEKSPAHRLWPDQCSLRRQGGHRNHLPRTGRLLCPRLQKSGGHRHRRPGHQADSGGRWHGQRFYHERQMFCRYWKIP